MEDAKQWELIVILVDLQRYRAKQYMRDFSDSGWVPPWKLLKLGDYLSLSLFFLPRLIPLALP